MVLIHWDCGLSEVFFSFLAAVAMVTKKIMFPWLPWTVCRELGVLHSNHGASGYESSLRRSGLLGGNGVTGFFGAPASGAIRPGEPKLKGGK